MENNDDYKSFKGHNHDTSKRRTPLQLEALEGLYSEDRYPSHKAMEEVALPLKLTYKQVRSWFIERRRKDKRQTSGTKESPLSSAFNRLTSKRHISLSSFGADDPYDVPGYTNKSIKRGNKSKSKQRATHIQATIRPLNAKNVPGSMLRRNKSNLKHKDSPIQASMRPLNFILKKVFRKDGPPLGVKFDPLPPEAFHHNTTGPTYGPTCARKTTVTKKRKVSDSPISYFEVNTKKKVSVMKHGMGKGLMTVWRATNPGAGCYPTGANFIGRDITDVHLNSKSAKQTNPPRRKMKKVHHNLATKKGRAGNKFLDRRNCAIRNAKVSNNKPENPKEPHQEECKLALEGLRSQEYRNTITNLVDDEELELRELQTGPNPLTCSAHLAFNGMHSCSLCKDLLARFPSHSIKMKQPLCVQPWGSSIELIKKLFKLFQNKKGDFCGPDRSKTNGSQAEEVELDGHPLQSIYLGSDRRFNSYWLFLGPCNAKDPGHRRIYFESSEDGHWEVIDTKGALCSLLSVLDGRGSREACLLAALTRLVAFLCEAMSTTMTNDNDMKQSGQSDQSSIDIVSGDGSSPISDVDNNLSLIETVNESVPSSQAIVLELRKVEEQKEKWDRLQAFDAWIWNSFYANLNAVKHSKRSYLDSLVRCASCHDLYWRDEKHCKICHTTFELDFDLEERYAIHVATCREKDSNMFPKHRVLSTQLQSLKAALHAIEVLTDFVGAINEEWLYQCNGDLNCDRAVDEIVESFPTIPQTTSAVALWLGKLDALIAPHSTRVHSEQAEGRTTKQKRKLAHC